MNNIRRKQIGVIIAKLEEITADIEALQEEEQDYYDNMPEAFQCGEKGDKANEAIDNFAEAVSSLEEVISNLEIAGA